MPRPALSEGRFDNTIFIKIVALAPRPNPRIPKAEARIKRGVVVEYSSIRAQPRPVKSKEPVRMRLGSKRSDCGPKRIEPRDMPRYIIEIAYPEIMVLSGCV